MALTAGRLQAGGVRAGLGRQGRYRAGAGGRPGAPDKTCPAAHLQPRLTHLGTQYDVLVGSDLAYRGDCSHRL
jgi:hypothetical protein